MLPALAWVHAYEHDTNNSSPMNVSALSGFWETFKILGICLFSQLISTSCCAAKNSFSLSKTYVEWWLHHLIIFACVRMNLEEKTARQCVWLITITPLNINIHEKKANHLIPKILSHLAIHLANVCAYSWLSVCGIYFTIKIKSRIAFDSSEDFIIHLTLHQHTYVFWITSSCSLSPSSST